MSFGKPLEVYWSMPDPQVGRGGGLRPPLGQYIHDQTIWLPSTGVTHKVVATCECRTLTINSQNRIIFILSEIIFRCENEENHIQLCFHEIWSINASWSSLWVCAQTLVSEELCGSCSGSWRPPLGGITGILLSSTGTGGWGWNTSHTHCQYQVSLTTLLICHKLNS